MYNDFSFTDVQKRKIIDYVMDNWISRYFGVLMIAKRKDLPKMTTKYSESPSYNSAVFSSQIENMAIEKAEASNWLEKLEEGLSNLPQYHQDIIRKKYLTSGSYGRRIIDPEVYKELGIGKTHYYSLKKEALFWLGMLLINQEQLLDILRNSKEEEI